MVARTPILGMVYLSEILKPINFHAHSQTPNNPCKAPVAASKPHEPLQQEIPDFAASSRMFSCSARSASGCLSSHNSEGQDEETLPGLGRKMSRNCGPKALEAKVLFQADCSTRVIARAVPHSSNFLHLCMLC